MNKRSAPRLFLFAAFGALVACGARPLLETYTVEPGAKALPPRDAIQYFLPQRLVSVTVQRTRTHRDSVSVRALPPVPDLTHVFYARIPASALRDDTYALHTTASGLLTSFASTSKDEGPALVVDSIELAALAPQIAAVGSALTASADALAATGSLPAGHTGTPAAQPCGSLSSGLTAASGVQAAAFKATVILDPTSPADLARAETELCTRGAHFRLVTLPVAAVAAAPEPVPVPSCAHKPVEGIHCEPLIYYRRDRPYVFTIYDGGTDGSAGYMLVSATLVQVPNAAPVERLSMTAAAGVSTRASAQFSDGMLLSAGATRPSPALAFADLPLQIARAIVSIPSALFQFRIDSTRDAARLTEAQTEAIKAETARLSAVAALRAKEGDQSPDASASVSAHENRDIQH